MTGLFYSIYLLDQLNTHSMYGQHAIYQLYTLLAFTICTFEIRYISMKLPAYILCLTFQKTKINMVL